jgi:hypothetical protein
MEKSVSFYPKMRFAAGLAVAVFCLLTSSCDLPPAWGDGKGSLTIALPGASGTDRAAAESRAAHLPSALTNDMRYEINFFSADGSNFSLSTWEKIVTIDLNPGRWDIIVEAFYSSSSIQTGIGKAPMVDILAGQANSISLSMDAEPFIMMDISGPFPVSETDITLSSSSSSLSGTIDVSGRFAGNISGWTDVLEYQWYYEKDWGDPVYIGSSVSLSSSGQVPLTLSSSNVVTNEVGIFRYYVLITNNYTWNGTPEGTARKRIHMATVTIHE